MAVSARGRSWAATAAVAAAAAAALAPLVWMAATSVAPLGAADDPNAPFLPAHPTLQHYRMLFTDYRLGRPLLNSVLVAGVTTTLALLISAPAGYAFAKLRFTGRERLLQGLVAALVIPGQVAMLPLFLMMRTVGLVDSYAGAILPGLAGIFSVLFIRQSALAIPDEMLDAARLDGAGEMRILLTVVAPLLRPVLVTLGVFVFLSSWNDFLWPLVVLADQRLYTLPVALAVLSREHGREVELMMAGAVVTSAPVLALFLLLQRHYVRGVLQGGIKG